MLRVGDELPGPAGEFDVGQDAFDSKIVVLGTAHRNSLHTAKKICMRLVGASLPRLGFARSDKVVARQAHRLSSVAATVCRPTFRVLINYPSLVS